MHIGREFLQQIGLWACLLLSLGLLSRDLSRASRRPAREREGWKSLRPCISLYALDVVALIMALFFSVSFVVAAFVVFSEPKDIKLWMMLVMAPPLTMLALYQLWYTLFVRIRFDETGIDWHGIAKHRFVTWGQIERIQDHSGLGPRTVCKDGSKLGVWEYLNGFAEFVATANSHGVSVEPSIARKYSLSGT